MKKIILIFLILFIFNTSFGQEYADKEYYLIDSLVLEELSTNDSILLEKSLRKYHDSKNDTLKMGALSLICQNMVSEQWVQYQVFQYQKIKETLKTPIFKTEKKRLEKYLAGALNNLGFVSYNKSDFNKALDYYHRAAKIYKQQNDDEGIATYLNNIGNVFYNQGDIPKALDAFLKSLTIRENLNNKNSLAYSLNNVAGIYNIQGNDSNALIMYNKALEIREEIGPKRSVAAIFTNIGFIYKKRGDTIKAFNSFDKAVKIQIEIGDKRGHALSLNHLGLIYNHFGDPLITTSKKEALQTGKPKALKCYQTSLELNEDIGSKDGVSNALYNIASIEFMNNHIVEAQNKALKSLSIAQEIKIPALINKASELLFKIYEKQGKGLKALEMHKLYIVMRDSINNIETQKATIKQQTKYEYDKQKAIDDAENEKLVAIEKEQKEKQQIMTYATAGGLGLTGIFLFVVFNRLRITRKQKLVIEEQKQEVENQRDIAHEQKLIVEEKNKEITESITYAKRIQEAILPPPRLVKEWLTESFIYYKPKDIVAGDFYWMETVTTSPLERGSRGVIDDNSKNHPSNSPLGERSLVFFAAADCTGHGVPGAMVSVVCANALSRAVKEFALTDPGQILDKVTLLVGEAFEKSDEQIKDGMDIALCALDVSAKKVYYSGANNPLYRVTTLNQKIETHAKTVTNDTHQLVEYKATKQPIGHNDNVVPFETVEIQLEPGDAIYLFSDGFPDQFGGVKGKKYKYSTFRKTLLGYFQEPMETQKQLLEKEFDTWKGDLEQIDDVCVIGVKINGKEKNNFTKRELEVLAFVKEGLPSKLIADKMNISKLTVDTYRKRLLAKSGTHNATELIAYCIEKEII